MKQDAEICREMRDSWQIRWQIGSARKSRFVIVTEKVATLFEAEAKERQARQAKANQPQSKLQNREIIPDSEKGKATEKAASVVGVNPRYVSDAKASGATQCE
jgi:hypothetical protein